MWHSFLYLFCINLFIISLLFNHLYIHCGNSCCIHSFFFFFMQKTAYEFSECDWSSDVCSSDLTRLISSHKQKTAYENSECDWRSDVCSSDRSEEHTSELQSHSEISYAVFCLKQKNRQKLFRGDRRCSCLKTHQVDNCIPSLIILT